MNNSDGSVDPYYLFEVWEEKWRAKNDPDYKVDLYEVIDIYAKENGQSKISKPQDRAGRG